EDQIDGVVLTFFDISALKKYQTELSRREKQQAAVAALGQLALQNVDLETLVDQATKQLCETLDLEYCDLLELNVDGDELFFRSGVGWQSGVVGQTSVSAGLGSQARYILDAGAPVRIANLDVEERFEVAPHLRKHNVVNGLAVAVPSIERTWGILGAYSSQAHNFSEDDAHFLQAVANVLAEAFARKASEAAIRLSEERFRTALKNAPITVFNQDQNLAYTWAYNLVPEGPELAGILGKRDEEIMERPQDAALLRTLKQQVLDQKQGRREEVAIAFGGQERYYDLTIEPLLDSDDKVVGITCASTDITQIKQAEQTLRTSEERLQIAVRNSGLSVSHVDGNLRYTWIVNPQHPFAREEIVGKTDAELLGAERASGLTALKRRVLESGQGIHQEYTMHTVTGPRTWDVTLEPIRRANGTIGGVTTASLDITTRKQAEEALRVSENRLRLAVEAGNMGIWHWNLNDDVLTWSDLQYTLLGLAPNEPMTMARFYALVHPDDRPQVQALFRQIQDAAPDNDEASFEHEYRVVKPDGQVRWLSTRGALSCRNAQSTEVVGVTFDVTTHHEQAEEIRSFNTTLEQRVQRRTAELERSNQELDQFAYAASHDLKAPLRAIQQLSNWLVEDLGDG
ncbi:MAG: PAS domain S-box protein, partial [Caldilineaceae bacterium]|nr:PAS domain S-box protein [Caldilineaceae bacterium]